MRTDNLRGHLDLVLLGTLAKAPGHGYAIIGSLKDQTGGVLDLPEGSVYPALHRLEDLGLVASEWDRVEGRRRRLYRLTAKGSEALAAEAKEWKRLSRSIETVLAAVRPLRPAHAGGAPA